MSTQQETFRQIDRNLATYYQRLGVPNYYNNDGNGVFINNLINDELFNDTELNIEDEFKNPQNCAYVWNWKGNFPVPHVFSIPHGQKESFIFYILQACFEGHSPSDKYIQDNILPKVGGKIVQSSVTIIRSNDDELDEKKDEFESGWFRADGADHYVQKKKMMAEIQLIANECAKPNKSLIKLVCASDANKVKLMNDLKVRMMLNGFKHGSPDIIENAAFTKVLSEFIRKEMHFEYNENTINEVEAMHVLGLPRWFGYSPFQQMMSNILRKSGNDSVINCDAGTVQKLLAAIMVVVPPYLLNYKSENCTAVFIITLPKSYEIKGGVIKSINQYVNEFRKSFDNKISKVNAKENTVIRCTIDLSQQVNDSLKIDLVEADNLRGNDVYFYHNMTAKKIFADADNDNIGITLYKFGEKIQYYLHNACQESAVRINLKDIFTWFRYRFKHRQNELNEADYDIFNQNLKMNWGDTEFDETVARFTKDLIQYPDLFEQIFGMKRISTEPFGDEFASDKDLNIFSRQSMKKCLHDLTKPQFGSNVILYLNMSTELQLKQMKKFTVDVAGKRRVLSLVNIGLHDERNKSLYCMIMQHELITGKLLWTCEEIVTEEQSFSRYGIINDELPKATRLLYQIQKQLMISNNIQAVISEKQTRNKYRSFVKTWNKKPKKRKLNANQLSPYLLQNVDTQCLRCFRSFLREENNIPIPAAAVYALYKHMRCGTNNSAKNESKEDQMEINLDYLNDEIKYNSTIWKDMHVAKILTNKIIPDKIDNPFVNLHDFMRKWLWLYQYSTIITEYQHSTLNISIAVTNYNFDQGRHLVFVVRESTQTKPTKHTHYILSAEQILNTYNINDIKLVLPQSPKSYLIPDEKVQAEIKEILKTVKERYKTIDRGRWENRTEIPIFGNKQKYKFTCCYKQKEFVEGIKDCCGEKMKNIRLEPIVAFNETTASVCIEYVWVVSIHSPIPTMNKSYHIGINVLALNSECIPKSLHLSIYDEQKLILIQPKHEWNGMDNIQIGYNTPPTAKKSSKYKSKRSKTGYKCNKNHVKSGYASHQTQSSLPYNNQNLVIIPSPDQQLLSFASQQYPSLIHPPHPNLLFGRVQNSYTVSSDQQSHTNNNNL